MPEQKSVFLYFREGSSDKVYNVHLTEGPGGWDVRFQNGRRGKPLRDGVKVQGAAYADAQKEFDKVMNLPHQPSRFGPGCLEGVSVSSGLRR